MSTDPRADDTGHDGEPHEMDVVLVGSWNVSWWSADRIAPICSLGKGLRILALQETRLARLPLETARGTARAGGFTIHHGEPVPVTRVGGHGNSCGVGFLTPSGVAVSRLPPQGAAWQKLSSMARVHAILIPPLPGLPRGVRLFSIYAPLQRDTIRDEFNSAFPDMVFGLDMQVPTLIMGDFNGTIAPQRDYQHTQNPVVCPLLARLLGPGGPFLDLLEVLSPEEHAWTFKVTHGNLDYASRLDLILWNRAAVPIVGRVFVRVGRT